MKPDPNSYKDKQRYKAKTGQQSKQKHESPASAANKKQREKSDRSAAAGQAESANTTTQNDAHCNAASDHTDGSEEQPSPVKSFRRRELVSNWSRYELPDETLEDGARQRGADFTQLLQSAGSSVAQLRLSDEQSWDKDIQDSSDADQLSAFLSLDCDDLTSALDCIPLYQCYGLEDIKDEIFTKDQIEAMKTYAEQCEQHYSPKLKTHDHLPLVNPDKQTASSKNVTDNVSSVDNARLTNRTQSARSVDKLSHDATINDRCDVSGDSPGSGRLKQSDNVNHNPCSIVPSRTASVSAEIQEEDDLDALLNMDNPVKALPHVENRPASPPNKQAVGLVSDLEDMLDSLLDD